MPVEHSPILIGTKQWTFVKQSIKTLLAGKKSACIVMNFYRNLEAFPCFGLTTFPVKDLFWELTKVDTPARNSCFVRVHEWDDMDYKYWEKFEAVAGDSVAILFEYEAQETNRIKISFQHGGRISNTYKYRLCPIQRDAYLIIFTPLNKFHGKDIGLICNPLSILGVDDYLREYGERMTENDGHNQAKREYSRCISCCTEIADIVFLPCGHASFCSACIKSFEGRRCPLCNVELGNDIELSRHKCKITSESCLVCPATFNCRRMNCMLVPCGCVIGCIKYAKRAIDPEVDKCLACEGEVFAMRKVFIQPENVE